MTFLPTPMNAAREAGPRARVKGKLAKAIDLIVFEGMPLDKAAAQAGLTTYTVRQALGKAHVIAYLKAKREVFRAEVCGQNIKRLAMIRDAANNQPAVNAIRALEQLDMAPPEHAATPTAAIPGLVIVVEGGAKVTPQRVLDVCSDETPTPSMPGIPLSRE